MRTIFVILGMTFALLAISLNPANVRADEIGRPSSAEALEHLKSGNRLYRVREFEKAIEEYKAGAVKEDAVIFSYNLAQSYRQLGRYEEAIWHYRLFLKRAKPSGEMKDAIEVFIQQMTDEQAKRARTQPPIEPATEPKPVTQPAAPVAPLATTQPVTSVKRSKRWYEDGLGWGATGAGAIGVGVSLGLFVTANGLDSDAEDEIGQGDRDALYARSHDRRVIGTIVGIAGGAMLAVGVVKLVMHPKDEAPQRTSLQLGVGHRGIALIGRF